MQTAVTSSPDVSATIERLRAINGNSFRNASQRATAVFETRALLARIESPWNTGVRFTWIQPALMACIYIAMKLQLFQRWQSSGSGPKTAFQLVNMVECDPLLFGASALTVL